MRPIRRERDMGILITSRPGTSSARTSELQTARGMKALYLGSCRRLESSRCFAIVATTAGRKKLTLPASHLIDVPIDFHNQCI